MNRVLLVDDSVEAATPLALLMEHAGATVRVAHDAASALEVYKEFKPALVFLDIGLPDMDGYELARQIRTLGYPRPPTLVALSGWAPERDTVRAYEAGFAHHLMKPVMAATLRALLVEQFGA